ncbi:MULTISPECIES: SpaA isopeptide-forming pilin-related protein [Bifidobacterium]|uniref:SpaA isopeptide-forming pilin-related protein n=1 Tax=Bifidobacterium TaxID=1678 RepID=UPI001BDDB6A2|nr:MULTISPECIES: SpaA isopeptide-forming pilin-related protein [Bifidobacterium]MBT1160952.1 isopeptide-forming domain-containing fimbrial protein [Bifidobacterium sp. SO1]MBW3077634.1 isopeptide-forming domain-containing fimbrial protein [Bifidobacterium simiiventris]
MMNTRTNRAETPGGRIARFAAAAICFLAILASGAIHSEHAMAANGTITIKSGDGTSLAGHTFNAYLLATYTDVELKDSSTLRSVSAQPANSAASTWISTALKAANVSVDASAGQNPASQMLRQTTGSQATRLIAATLEANKSGRTPAKANQTSNGSSLTLTLAEGFYLITDSAGMPIIASTTISGTTAMASGSTLGTVYMKSKVSVPNKEIKSVDGTWKESAAATNGETRQFRVRFSLPNHLAADTVTVDDVMDGMQYVSGTFKAKISAGKNAGKDVTSEFGKVGSSSTGKGYKVTSSQALIDNYGTQQVEISYSATITDTARAKAASNTVTVTINWLPGTNPPGVDPPKPGKDFVRVPTYGIDLKKISAASTDQNRIPVEGAKFIIKNETLGKWLNWDAGTKRWAYVDTEAKAQQRATDANGVISYDRLGAGTYLISETVVPKGYFGFVKPSFRVTIDDAGTISITGVEQAGLTASVSKANGATSTPVAVVKNVDNMTQLPMTGGVTVGLMGAGGLSVMGLALASAVKAGKLRRDGLDAAWRS